MQIFSVSVSANNNILTIYRNNSEVNQPFKAEGMFPGDSITKKYRVDVSYTGKIVVYFKPYIRTGSEKLADVLRCSVKINQGEELYDGLMKDMQAVEHILNAGNRGVTDSINYEICVYLDTSVGNEYKNKELVADYQWWAYTSEDGYRPDGGTIGGMGGGSGGGGIGFIPPPYGSAKPEDNPDDTKDGEKESPSVQPDGSENGTAGEADLSGVPGGTDNPNVSGGDGDGDIADGVYNPEISGTSGRPDGPVGYRPGSSGAIDGSDGYNPNYSGKGYRPYNPEGGYRPSGRYDNDKYINPDYYGQQPQQGSDAEDRPTGKLISPKTGDTLAPLFWAVGILICAGIIFFLLIKRKKEDEEVTDTNTDIAKKLTICIAIIIILSVCLCITTFALIHSMVSVEENIFRTGELKIGIYNEEKMDAPIIEADEFLFEPGMRVVKKFYVKNNSTDPNGIWYKIYFENVAGGLASVLDVKITDEEKNVVLYNDKAINLTRDKTLSSEFAAGDDEWRELSLEFYYPEDSGNSTQNAELMFNVVAEATQKSSNPYKEFS